MEPTSGRALFLLVFIPVVVLLVLSAVRGRP
jgi:hypothetical protein